MSEQDYFQNTPEYQSETNPFYRSSINPNQNNTASTYYNPNLSTRSVGSGRSNTGLNPAQQDMASSGISAGAQVAGSIIQGVAQNSGVNSARNQSRQLYNQQRQDELNQTNISNSLKQKMVEQDEKNFQINKMQQEADLRHNIFLSDFQKALDDHQKLTGAATNLFGVMNNNEKIKDFLIKSFAKGVA